MWRIVVRAFQVEAWVHITVEPESKEKEQPPSYYADPAGQPDGEDDCVVILALDENNRAFVSPGSTFDVSSLHHDHPRHFSQCLYSECFLLLPLTLAEHIGHLFTFCTIFRRQLMSPKQHSLPNYLKFRVIEFPFRKSCQM
jgi:hypothetical protein